MELMWKKWQDLANDTTLDTDDWKEWETRGGKVRHAINNCLACAYGYCYNAETNRNDYTKCIMAGLWPDGCEAKNSPFSMWKPIGNKDRSHHAQTIADFAKKKYYEEIGRKK